LGRDESLGTFGTFVVTDISETIHMFPKLGLNLNAGSIKVRICQKKLNTQFDKIM
jgi:hypothetical protein